MGNFSGYFVYSLDEQLDIGCGWALLADGYLMLLIVRNKMVGINKVEQFLHGLVNFTVRICFQFPMDRRLVIRLRIIRTSHSEWLLSKAREHKSVLFSMISVCDGDFQLHCLQRSSTNFQDTVMSFFIDLSHWSALCYAYVNCIHGVH